MTGETKQLHIRSERGSNTTKLETYSSTQLYRLHRAGSEVLALKVPAVVRAAIIDANLPGSRGSLRERREREVGGTSRGQKVTRGLARRRGSATSAVVEQVKNEPSADDGRDERGGGPCMHART